MIIKTDGPYYIMVCEKCGAEIRKHKSYCTRYGETYHFNPELKCNHCGFSVKIIRNTISTPSFPLKMANEEISTPKATANCIGVTSKCKEGKAKIINKLNDVIKELAKGKEIDEAAKIIFLADFGMIEGVIRQPGEYNGLNQRIFRDFNEIRDNYLLKMEKEVVPSDYDQSNHFITVLNAKIIPFSNPNHTITMEVLNLFSDQITGFTFGKYQSEN